MEKIALDEHFFARRHLAALRAGSGYSRLETFQDANRGALDRFLRMPSSSQVIPPRLMERLTDMGNGRLAEMDRAGIDVQVLSMAGPGVEELDPPTAAALARRINDELAEVLQAHPDRYAGFETSVELFTRVLRTSTGATIVALLRSGAPLVPNSGVIERLDAGAITVVLGSPRQLAEAGKLLGPREPGADGEEVEP